MEIPEISDGRIPEIPEIAEIPGILENSEYIFWLVDIWKNILKKYKISVDGVEKIYNTGRWGWAGLGWLAKHRSTGWLVDILKKYKIPVDGLGWLGWLF